jgi:hypothetical protein
MVDEDQAIIGRDGISGRSLSSLKESFSQLYGSCVNSIKKHPAGGVHGSSRSSALVIIAGRDFQTTGFWAFLRNMTKIHPIFNPHEHSVTLQNPIRVGLGLLRHCGLSPDPTG